MATFFGEILPVTSRAVDDDEDDDDTHFTPLNPVICWSKIIQEEVEKLPGKKIVCSNFIIAIGIEASVFTEVYFKKDNYEMIGGIFTNLKEDDPIITSQTSLTDKTCSIYRCCSHPSVLLCQSNQNILPEQSYTWTKLLLDSLDLSAAEITVLASCGTGSYCSDIPASKRNTPFLRAMKTDKFIGSPVCKILEQPNMLTGLLAQLLTFFQIYHYKALAYICFKDSKYMDYTDVKIFLPVLHGTTFKGIVESSSGCNNVEQKLKELMKIHTIHDTLYM